MLPKGLRIQTLMLWIVIIALALLPILWFLETDRAIDEFYRPGGRLDQERQRNTAPAPSR